MYGNAKLDAVFWFFLGGSGVLVAPFWQHFGGAWDPNGCLFQGFWGSGGVLGRLGRAVCVRHFSSMIYGNAELYAVSWFVLGVRGPYWLHCGMILEVLGVQMGIFWEDFGGHGAILGRLRRPVGSRDPSLRLRRPILTDFGSKLGHPWVPKSSQNQ